MSTGNCLRINFKSSGEGNSTTSLVKQMGQKSHLAEQETLHETQEKRSGQ